MTFIAKTDWAAVGKPLFITLTYPDALVPRHYSEMTAARSAVWRTLEEYAGKRLSAIWRIEYVPRRSGMYKGMHVPHIHLVVNEKGRLEYDRVNAAWGRALGTLDYVRTEVRRAKETRNALAYVAKYCAKPVSSSLVYPTYLSEARGRAWGILRKGDWPFASSVCGVIPPGPRADWLRAEANRIYEGCADHDRDSFRLLGDRADQLADKIRATRIDNQDSPA